MLQFGMKEQLMNHSDRTDHFAENDIAVAADLGGTHLRVAAVDSNGKVLDRIKLQTPTGDYAEDIVRAVSESARTLENRLTNRKSRFRAISVVVPGTVHVESGVVVKAPNLPCLNAFHLAAALEEELNCPAVIENDANAAAVGEAWAGAGRGYKSIICITLGTGVGGGIILDEKLLRGIDGSAGEIGHICVEANGYPCPCGSRGCLERYSSATAIVRITKELLPQYQNSPLSSAKDITASSIYDAGLRGDKLALEVFRIMGFYLGVGLASLVNVLNPEIIVLGGGVSAGWDLFYQHVREQVDARAFSVPARRARILRTEQGDDAGLLGAARIAFLSNIGHDES
jgi:glucokinase